jgi:hypothetical protein
MAIAEVIDFRGRPLDKGVSVSLRFSGQDFVRVAELLCCRGVAARAELRDLLLDAVVGGAEALPDPVYDELMRRLMRISKGGA